MQLLSRYQFQSFYWNVTSCQWWQGQIFLTCFVIVVHAFWWFRLRLLNSGVLMRQYSSKNMFLFFWSLEFNSFAYTATNILKRLLRLVDLFHFKTWGKKERFFCWWWVFFSFSFFKFLAFHIHSYGRPAYATKLSPS